MKVTLSTGLPRVSSFSRKGSFSRKRNSKKQQQHEARTSNPVPIAGKPPIAPVDARDDTSSSDSAASIRKTGASPETREADHRPPRPAAKKNNKNLHKPPILPTVEPVRRKGSFSLRPPKFGRSGSFAKKTQEQKAPQEPDAAAAAAQPQQQPARGSQEAQASISSDESKIDAGHDDQEELKDKWRAVNDAPDEYAVPLFDGRSSMNHGWHHAEEQAEKHGVEGSKKEVVKGIESYDGGVKVENTQPASTSTFEPCRQDEGGARKDGGRSASSSGRDDDATPGGIASSWHSIDGAAKAIEKILGVKLCCN